MENASPPSSALPFALVVDDNSLIRMNAADILEDAGFQTLEASHVEEALSVLREHHPATPCFAEAAQRNFERCP